MTRSRGKRPIVELEELRQRLSEAEETLAAIRNGEVDSLIVTGPHGDQVFSLKGAEQPYRVFVEQMLEGAVTLDPQGTILYCNRRFAEIVRSRLERVIGTPIQSFVRAGDQLELAEILKDPADRKVRYVLAAVDGKFIPVQLGFSRLALDDADAICVVVTDLTEQEEKRELATALQNLQFAQHQLQQQNDALARARADAEAANIAKDDFLAALSHELRTPLTPVLMTVAALEADQTLPPSAHEDVALIRRNVELEARLIDDLLDLTRIARGKTELNTEVADAHRLLAGALDICRSDISGKRLHLVEDLRAAEPYIEADPVRLQQILWNLLRNAVKFTPDGGRILIRTYNANGLLHLEVSDTGVGIDGDAIGKIFAPFEQAGRSITRRFGGLGLGLAISKRLAELHGGTIAAHSDGQGRGATFRLTLPAVPRPDPLPDTPPVLRGARAARRLQILIVEDHEDTRRSMVRLLSLKHSVRDACDIATALATASSEPFDLVISDLGLPDGSGLDLMRELRRLYNIEGICLTGFGMDEDLLRSADAGFCHHLTKPVDLSKLESVIDSLCK